MLRVLVLALLALLAPLHASGQSRYLNSPEEARKVAEGIAASVASGNFTGAFKELRPLSVVPPAEFDVFEAQFNSQAANLLKQFGSTTGYEFIREDRVGTRLVRYQFVVFHEKSALRWNFVFYKAEKGWSLAHFHFDGNALTFFQNAS
jgi:hypothetical protein